MIRRTKKLRSGATRQPVVRVGYIPLVDAAPLLVASELGFFDKYRLSVKVSQEAGWATIRDKIIFGELEAAHSLGALPFVTTRGLGCVSSPTVCSFVFNLHGDCITLSNNLRQRGVTDAISLKRVVQEDGRKHIYTFATVFPYSTHSYLLRKWFLAGGIDPDRDVRIVVVPPSQMYANLKTGNLDGYCVGEPWNSLAIIDEVGWCPIVSAQLDPLHPEKVLMARTAFVQQREEEHLGLIAGLIEGALFCDHLRNREEVIRILSKPEYLGISAQYLRNSLEGGFAMGDGSRQVRDDFILFHRFNTNEPTLEKARLILQQMRGCGTIHSYDRLSESLAERVFRPRLYQQAMKLRQQKESKKAPRPPQHFPA